MALNYKIITRKVSDLKGGAKTDKAFATPVYTGYHGVGGHLQGDLRAIGPLKRRCEGACWTR